MTPSGPVDGPPTATMMRAALSRDAGEVTIRASQGLPALRPPRPGFGVRDLVSTGWGARVLAQGALLAMVVFLITVVPMLNWFTGVTGPVPNAAAGADAGRSAAGGAGGRADGGLAHRAHDRARAWTG